MQISTIAIATRMAKSAANTENTLIRTLRKVMDRVLPPTILKPRS
jgi:hypothetical protein